MQVPPTRIRPPLMPNISDLFGSRRLLVLLGGSIALLVIMTGFATHSVRDLAEEDEWLTHTEEVRFQIGEVLQALTDAETAERGYAITREKTYLAPYDAALLALPTQTSRLAQLTADNPVQRPLAAQLATLAQARVELARQVVAAGRAGNFEAARSLIAGGGGRNAMDLARTLATQMQAEETRLLAARNRVAREGRRGAQRALWTAGLLAVFLLTFVCYAALRDGHRLRSAQEDLATTLKSIGDAVISTDAAGVIRFMNPVAERLTGWSVANARGRPLEQVFRIVNERTRAPVESPVARVLREGAMAGLANHTVLISRSGTEIAIDDSGAPIRDGERLMGVVLVFRDATIQRAAARTVRNAEDRLRIALSAARAGAFDWNIGTGELLWTEGIYVLLGLDPNSEPATYTLWRRYIHPDDIERVEALIQQAIRTTTRFEADYRIIAQDRTERWIQGQGLIITRGKEAVRMVGTMVDITQRIRTEQIFRATFENAAVGIAHVAPDGRWLRVNDELCRIVGYSREELEGLKFGDITHPDDLERDWNQAQALLKGEIATYTLEKRCVRKDGSLVWACLTVSLVRDAGPEHFVSIIEDISDRKRTEENLRHTEAALIEADRRKDVFLATLSHELRNPLAPIRNAAKVLESQDLLPAELERARLIIGRQVRHMAALLDDLLDLTRITRGVFALKRAFVNLQGLLAEGVETARPAIDAKRHTLDLEWPTAPIDVDVDPVRFVQIIANLLTNAAKYTDPEGHITLGVVLTGRTLVLFVRDTGVGLAPQTLTRVFEMFSQVDAHDERSEGGLGIGLALVKGLVELHGGRVEARSTGLERGTEFVVTLPEVCVARTSPQPPATAVTGPQRRIARRVVVADDNRDGAESLGMLLQLAGHEVHIAHTGPEALQLAARHRPHVAILDIGMPGMSGYEVAEQIRREPWGAGMRLIALTGRGQDDDKVHARLAGFDLHWTKPLDPEALAELSLPPGSA